MSKKWSDLREKMSADLVRRSDQVSGIAGFVLDGDLGPLSDLVQENDSLRRQLARLLDEDTLKAERDRLAAEANDLERQLAEARGAPHLLKHLASAAEFLAREVRHHCNWEPGRGNVGPALLAVDTAIDAARDDEPEQD